MKMKYFFFLIVIMFGCISSSDSEKVDLEENIDIFMNILMKKKGYSFEKNYLSHVYSGCELKYLGKLGFSENFQVQKKRTFNELKEAGFSDFEIKANVYQKIKVGEFDIISGITCIEDINTQLEAKIGYSLLLDENSSVKYVSFSYYYVNGGVGLGCENIQKLLDGQIYIILHSRNFKSPCLDFQ